MIDLLILHPRTRGQPRRLVDGINKGLRATLTRRRTNGHRAAHVGRPSKREAATPVLADRHVHPLAGIARRQRGRGYVARQCDDIFRCVRAKRWRRAEANNVLRTDLRISADTEGCK